MKTKTENLSMQVHRLLHSDGCWHDIIKVQYSEEYDHGHYFLCQKCKKTTLRKDNPDYAHDLNAAWECVEYLAEKNIKFHLHSTIGRHGHYFVEFETINRSRYQEDRPTFTDSDYETATAICKAFVQAMGEEPQPVEITA